MKKLTKDDLKLKGQMVTGLTDGVILECQDTRQNGDCYTKDTDQECKDTVRQCTFDTLEICQHTQIESCFGNQTKYETCPETNPCIVDTLSGGILCCDRTFDTECPQCVVVHPSVTECPLTRDEGETCEQGPVICGETALCVSQHVCYETDECPETVTCANTFGVC
jgi:hypothetical protein